MVSREYALSMFKEKSYTLRNVEPVLCTVIMSNPSEFEMMIRALISSLQCDDEMRYLGEVHFAIHCHDRQWGVAIFHGVNPPM